MPNGYAILYTGDTMEQNINRLVHKIIQEHITNQSICLDATCGNGHDTLFLATKSQYVYGIDIQEAAIQSTKQRLLDANIDNVSLILGSHDQLVQLIDPTIQFDIVMYNLGYLPSSNHHIITKADSTIASLEQVLLRLNPKGLITLTIYTGHPGGQEEALAIDAFVASLDSKAYLVQTTRFINRNNSPYIIVIEKT